MCKLWQPSIKIKPDLVYKSYVWWLGCPLLVCRHWIFFCYISADLEAVKAFISAECNVGDLEFPLSWQLVPLSMIHTQTQMHMCRLIGWFVCVWEIWSSQQKQPLWLPEAISRRKHTLTQKETIIFAHTASERTSTLVMSRQKERIPCCSLTIKLNLFALLHLDHMHCKYLLSIKN